MMTDKVPLNVYEGAPCTIIASSNCTIESGDGITLIGCHGVTENRDGALWVGNVDLTDLDDAEEIATALRTFIARENARTTPDLDDVACTGPHWGLHHE